MAGYFFDTSALTKRYHAEPGTPKVQAIFLERAKRVLISHLTIIEMRSVAALKVRTRALDPAQGVAMIDRFQADLANGVIDVFAITPFDYRRAETLLGLYGFTSALRSLDALQLSVALDLRDQGIVNTMVVADRTMAKIAAQEGLEVLLVSD